LSPTDHLDQLRAATGRLFRSLEGLTDDLAAGPSKLPGWTRGHVLTHLARNADAHWAMTDGALDGRRVPMYEGGRPARNQAIEDGSGRRAAELADDVRKSATRLQSIWHGLAEPEWDLPSEPGGPGSGERPVRENLVARWREVEVHHADLDLGNGSADWSPAYIDMDLPRIVESMPDWATPDAPRLISWFLRDDTTGNAWIVTARGIRPGVGSATHMLHAPGHALLAWLLGREPTAPIQVDRTNDEAVALALPRYFPFR
jgi:maleylpyruvate isomerase